jgi:segregation and condensation protein B
MNEHDLKHIIEATLLAAGKPVTSEQLLELFDERERPTPELLQTALGLLAADYENRGIELVEVASGWRIQVRPRTGEIVSRLWQERPSKYSRALLETLALVAYRQPITRSEIEEIRGVSISSTIMRTLQERNWIRTVGHREVPGRPELLGTTREFLDYFGLKSLDQLPTLAELKDIETIGVQLELPSEPAQTAPAEGSEEAAAATGEETVASSEDQAASAEGEGAEESDESDESDDSDESEAQDSDDGDETEEVSAEASDGTNDDSELSADAEDGDEDSDVSPTMVAADEDEQRPISEPPREE